jgi:putative phosphoribosyl transferase
MIERFRDRAEAGRLLAQELVQYGQRRDVVVLGLPRGGVPVAYEVASRLGAPLDVFVVRKLGVPGHPELAMGAISSGGVQVINRPIVRGLGIDMAAIEEVVAVEQRELQRREQAFRPSGPIAPLCGQTVIVVDDGLATGATMRAAVKGIRLRGAEKVVVAVPVADPQSWEEVARGADRCVCLLRPPELVAIGLWYEDFSQTSDEDVRALLERAARERHAALVY